MSKHLVFVYGTLRRGGGGRAMPEVFPGAKFVGEASASGGLYDLGPYPGLRLDASGSPVVGEVYEIGDGILEELDAFEASSRYRREQAEVSLGSRRATCWVYVPEFESYTRRALITSGGWTEYARTKTEWPEEVWRDEAQG